MTPQGRISPPMIASPYANMMPPQFAVPPNAPQVFGSYPVPVHPENFVNMMMTMSHPGNQPYGNSNHNFNHN